MYPKMTPLSLAAIFLLLTLSLLSITSSSITLPLTPLSTTHTHALKLAVSATLTRSRHLKKIHLHPPPPPLNTPLHPKSYGGYSIDLNVGTPPQPFPFLLDTASTLLWLPCSSHYLCSKCSNTLSKPFIPANSSSSKLLGCTNPKCTWLFGPNVESHCCKQNNNCSSQTCPAYTIQYGLGSTAGFLLSENLNFPEKIIRDFLLGCSLVSIHQPAGIAGFGRGPESLPSQMNLTRFSYCLLSHTFNDSPSKTSNLIMETTPSKGTKTNAVTYTPFSKNENAAFGAYYYVTLRRIFVGGKRVRVPRRLLETDIGGNGGFIVDSGSTFTFMERPIYDMVAREFRRQVNYTRAAEVEARSGLGPCFVVPFLGGGGTMSFPELRFEFRGGAKMRLPVANYFSLVGESDVACLTVVSDDVAGGPAVILGNYQQQNFYVEYDLENQRFGFRSQSCETSL
ncbi:hypothetical protein Fmac_027403 [Flemingia macrophylla]|uniref:Peptidase A1 domain-containing protein n=1 Tax=Flemingia macrophylla TaxID=520843 RepID=A0ABD1LHL6_9FABA